MSQKLRIKIKQNSPRMSIKIRSKRARQKVQITHFILIFALVALAAPKSIASAVSCPDLRIVFARGSGGAQEGEANYFAFRDTIRAKVATTALSYEFINLEYPAVGVGADNLLVTLGALIGGGEAYTFGRSVATGSQNLINLVNSDACPATKYVIGGYSQGAIVISKSLPKLNADKIIYAATFGDPKIYLPEGKGPYPDACRNVNLSEYRRYVPDCYTYNGMLGGYQPYEPASFSGKLGTWCNKHDFFCSPFLDMAQHTAYVADNLYEDASRVIFDKINQYYNLGSKVSSPHDTAILIDGTGSMSGLIKKYKAEAARLASETLESGGRVALYSYGDLAYGTALEEYCNFETCTMDEVNNGLQKLFAQGGGDAEESLLSASFQVMNKLQWKFGSTKSLVVLTDAGFHSPDLDGVTFDQVVSLSRQIDPVNFYIITKPHLSVTYQDLATQTDGQVFTDFDTLNLTTDYIMDRYDSLPRVEESAPLDLPELMVKSVERLDDARSRVSFESSGSRTLVALNDAILGVTDETEIILTYLNRSETNQLTLVPLTDTLRGEPVTINIDENNGEINTINDSSEVDSSASTTPSTAAPVLPTLPKAPNTGKIR